MKTKQTFSRRSDLLGMVKPEITKIDPEDLNVSSVLTDRNLFSKSSDERKGADADVDVNGNSVISTLFSDNTLCSAANAETATKIHGGVLDFITHVENALNVLKLGTTRIFNLKKMIEDARDTLDTILLVTVAYVSEHIAKFGADLPNCIEKIDHVASRTTRWIQDSTRWMHLTADQKATITEELDKANDAIASAVDASLEEDVPYVEPEVDLKSGTDVEKPGKAVRVEAEEAEDSKVENS